MDAAQEGMFANVLSELIGIYISVRLIDLIIRKNETRDRVRVRTVRTMRFVERCVANILLFKNGFEVDRLRRELLWSEQLREKRNKHLSSDEIQDLNLFYGRVVEFTTLIPDYLTVFDGGRITVGDEEAAIRLLHEIEEARYAAEKNILEETEEDAGL